VTPSITLVDSGYGIATIAGSPTTDGNLTFTFAPPDDFAPSATQTLTFA
jgi:hypothetical protein